MEGKGLVWVVLILAIILLVSNVFMFGSLNKNRDAIENQEVKVNVDSTETNLKLTSLENAVNDLKTELTSEEVSNEEVSNGEYVLNQREYEDELSEKKALELVMEELNSKDFKKEVFDTLENYGVDIDSYRDITEIKLMDSDVNVRRDTGKVDLELKVYYFLDGDEEETEKARLDELTMIVNDLDFDEEFEDAEVDNSYLLVVSKVYS